MNRKAQVASNINYLFQKDGLLKVAASHVHLNVVISETVPDRVVVTTGHVIGKRQNFRRSFCLSVVSWSSHRETLCAKPVLLGSFWCCFMLSLLILKPAGNRRSGNALSKWRRRHIQQYVQIIVYCFTVSVDHTWDFSLFMLIFYVQFHIDFSNLVILDCTMVG